MGTFSNFNLLHGHCTLLPFPSALTSLCFHETTEGSLDRPGWLHKPEPPGPFTRHGTVVCKSLVSKSAIVIQHRPIRTITNDITSILIGHLQIFKFCLLTNDLQTTVLFVECFCSLIFGVQLECSWLMLARKKYKGQPGPPLITQFLCAKNSESHDCHMLPPDGGSILSSHFCAKNSTTADLYHNLSWPEDTFTHCPNSQWILS